MIAFARSLFKVSLACSLLMMTAQAYSLIIEEVVYLNSQEIPRIITAETIP